MCWVILLFLELNPALPPALPAGVPGPPLSEICSYTYILPCRLCYNPKNTLILTLPVAPSGCLLSASFRSCTPNLPAWVAHNLRHLFICLSALPSQTALAVQKFGLVTPWAGWPLLCLPLNRVVTQVCLFVCVVGCGYHNPACRLLSCV